MSFTTGCHRPVQRPQNGIKPGYLVEKLQNARDIGKFCDFSIQTGPEIFSVHKCVLGLSSDYFATMFTTEMKEKYETTVTLDDINPDVMKEIINFMYARPLTLGNSDIFELFSAANYFQIEILKKKCGEYLKNKLLASNLPYLMTIWEHANKFSMESLQAAVESHISKNFSLLLNEDDISSLELYHFKVVLKFLNNTLTDEYRFKKIMIWIKHDLANREEHLSELFAVIDLDSIPKSILSELVSNDDAVMRSPQCLKMIINSLANRLPDNKLEKFLFCANEGSSYSLYDVTTDRWSLLTPLDKGKRMHASVVVCDDGIYVIGGEVNQLSVPSVHFISTEKDQGWKACPQINEPRQNCSSALYKSCIYVAGGRKHFKPEPISPDWFVSECLSSVECFDIKNQKWINTIPIPSYGTQQLSLSLVACGNYLYTLCCKRFCYNVCTLYIEQFDGKKWEKISELPNEIPVQAVALNKQLFCLCKSPLRSQTLALFRYNCARNCWKRCAPLTSPANDVSLCVANGKLYAHWMSTSAQGTFKSILEGYNISANKWTNVKKFAVGNAGKLLASCSSLVVG
ncbi:kelch repeat and BTB domain-containing protein 3-like [Clavelina lepadiformis]|uniref:kelch repeat and BTB domain-containing protein 3-like n=1 Tax=Clavelina lepadiformis TaxID=159417 RepID=UPI004041C72E